MIKNNNKAGLLYVCLVLFFPVLPVLFTAFLSQDSIVSTQIKRLGFIVWGLSFSAILAFLFSPRLLLYLLIPVVALACLEIYIVYIIRSASEEGMIISVLETNFGEALEIVLANRLYLIASVVYIGLYICLLFKIPLSFRLTLKTRLSLLFIFLIVQSGILLRDLYIAWRLPAKKSRFEYVSFVYWEKIQKTFPLNWMYNSINYIGKRKQLDEYRKTIKDFSFHVKNQDSIHKRRVIIIVIGETARKHNFSLYGYERETNPRLGKESRLIQMNNAETPYNNTIMAYTVFLSRATPDNFDRYLKEPSIIKAFSEAGFYTAYISNQSLIYGSLYQAYAEQADTILNLYTSMTMHSPDDRILPVFAETLQQSKDQDLCIVIHSMGSHFRYNFRYPKRFDHFTPSIGDDLDLAFISEKQRKELINAYDNSILFTDYFLAELINELNKDTVSASLLMYASDHGENIFDDENKKFAHGGPNPSRFELEIPLFFWRSEQYDQLFPEKVENLKANQDKPVNTAHFFPTILDLSGIIIESEGEVKSFAQSDF